jgi:hypothetical protein
LALDFHKVGRKPLGAPEKALRAEKTPSAVVMEESVSYFLVIGFSKGKVSYKIALSRHELKMASSVASNIALKEG